MDLERAECNESVGSKEDVDTLVVEQNGVVFQKTRSQSGLER